MSIGHPILIQWTYSDRKLFSLSPPCGRRGKYVIRYSFSPMQTQMICPLDIPFVHWIHWTSLTSNGHSSVQRMHRTYKCPVDISKCSLHYMKNKAKINRIWMASRKDFMFWTFSRKNMWHLKRPPLKYFETNEMILRRMHSLLFSMTLYVSASSRVDHLYCWNILLNLSSTREYYENLHRKISRHYVFGFINSDRFFFEQWTVFSCKTLSLIAWSTVTGQES